MNKCIQKLLILTIATNIFVGCTSPKNVTSSRVEGASDLAPENRAEFLDNGLGISESSFALDGDPIICTAGNLFSSEHLKCIPYSGCPVYFIYNPNQQSCYPQPNPCDIGLYRNTLGICIPDPKPCPRYMDTEFVRYPNGECFPFPKPDPSPSPTITPKPTNTPAPSTTPEPTAQPTSTPAPPTPAPTASPKPTQSPSPSPSIPPVSYCPAGTVPVHGGGELGANTDFKMDTNQSRPFNQQRDCAGGGLLTLCVRFHGNEATVVKRVPDGGGEPLWQWFHFNTSNNGCYFNHAHLTPKVRVEISAGSELRSVVNPGIYVVTDGYYPKTTVDFHGTTADYGTQPSDDNKRCVAQLEIFPGNKGGKFILKGLGCKFYK